LGGLLSYDALGSSEALGIFEITGVGNNQTGNPMVSLGRLNVAMDGGPTFPKEGNVKGSSGKGVPPLVFPRVYAIDTNST
jgi:hypothetical protein